MIVSLSLIQLDTVLRLDCQQIVTHCNSKYVLVALRLTGLVGLAETQSNYYSNNLMGEIRRRFRRIHGFRNLCYFLG